MIGSDLAPVEKDGTGSMNDPGTLLVVNDPFQIEVGIVAQLEHGQFGSLGDVDGERPFHDGAGRRATQSGQSELIGGRADALDLSPECVHAPKVVLPPVSIERMAMALRALNLVAEEYPGSTRCH